MANLDAPPEPKVERLSAYVLTVMRSWSPSVIPAADYVDVAHSIAVACLEHPSSDPAEDADRARGARVLRGRSVRGVRG